MVKKTLPDKAVPNREHLRDEWVAAVDELATQVERWCAEKNWWTHREDKTVTEDRIGAYAVPVLRIQTPTGRLILDPISRHVAGASGRIDLCVFPSYDFLILARTEKGWRLASAEKDGVDRPWSKKVFFDAASQLVERA